MFSRDDKLNNLDYIVTWIDVGKLKQLSSFSTGAQVQATGQQAEMMHEICIIKIFHVKMNTKIDDI